MGLGRVKTPTFNLRVEIPSRFRKFENQKCLRPLLREDDRENNSAHSWLLHVFTQPGSKPEVTPLKRQVRSTPQKRTSSGDSRMSVSCQSRPKCAAANCAGDHLIDTNMRHSEAKHPGGLMVDDNSNLADCTTPRLGVGAALRPLGRTHDAFDHHGRDAREHGLGYRGCQDVGNRT